MAKANATDSPGQSQKMISTDVVAVLLMAMDKTTVSKTQFEMMSALDGTRTASGFEHMFRPITAKAKELKKRKEQGEEFIAVAPGHKRGPTTTPATPRKRKAPSDEEEATPSKKKATPKPRAKKTKVEEKERDAGENESEGDLLPVDASEFIKKEKDWETEFV
ncbi:hypothetical protein ACN47E_009113 [Coniothyrium glycines]